jgi:NADH dehydrogenase
MTLLVIGGTSKVGQVLVPAALESRAVRVATRTPRSTVAADLRSAGAEIVAADLRDRASLDRALDGVTEVVAAAHGFPGTRGNDVQSVDRDGHRSLIAASEAAGVGRFLYVSAVGAGPDVPVDLYRTKYEIEQALVGSRLDWTVLRATAFMEFWSALVGEPVLTKGRTVVFGRGRNPVNFVSAGDVARLALVLLDDPSANRTVVELGGPEDISMNDVAQRFGRAANRSPRIVHVPLGAMKVMNATVGRVVKPLGRQLSAGILMDTAPMGFDPVPTLRRWPMELTTLDEVIARRVGG